MACQHGVTYQKIWIFTIAAVRTKISQMNSSISLTSEENRTGTAWKADELIGEEAICTVVSVIDQVLRHAFSLSRFFGLKLKSISTLDFQKWNRKN